MDGKQKKKRENLLAGFIIAGTILCCGFLFALMQRRFEEENRQRRIEWQQMFPPSVSTDPLAAPRRQRADSVQPSAGPRRDVRQYLVGTANDEEEDGDLYDDPDFDDLIPGDEYDEEFVDRDQGDPELYE